MKNMKRMTALLLAVLMVLSAAAIFASCGRKIPVLPEDSSGAAVGTEPNTERENETENPDESETPGHVHDWKEVGRRGATCTADGYIEEICSICGNGREQITEKALGHDFDAGTEHAATCGVNAYTEYKCSRCGEVKRDFREGTATGEHVFGDKPTYVKDGNNKVYAVCMVCGFLKELSDDELRQAIYNSLRDFTQEVVAYDCGDADIADSYVKIFELMKEAGITSIVSCCQGMGTVLIPQLLEACEEAGMNVYLNMHGMEPAEMVYRLSYYAEGYDCVRGIYMKDEPVLNMFENLAEAKRRILEEVEGATGWLIGANMLPYGDRAFEPGDHGHGYVSDGWYNSMVYYMETVKPDYFCFDRYPWNSTGDFSEAANSPNQYVANLLVAKKIADLYNVPLHTYLQTVAVGGYKAPTETQFRCEVNLSLACGADALYLFTVYEGHGFTGFISREGDELADMYYIVQTVIEEVNTMKGIYDLFDLDKVMTVGCDNYAKAMKNFSEAEDYLTDSYGKLTSVTTDGKCFIGCMKDDAGREGFYVVNNNYLDNGNDTYELTFAEETTYQLWTMDGLVAMGKASSLTLNLMPGEGQFLVLGGENVPVGTTEVTPAD